VAELTERFLAEYQSPRIKNRKLYSRSSGYSLKPVLAIIGNKQAAQLTKRDIERVRDVFLEEHQYKPNTLWASFRPLGAMFNWAVSQGLMPINPLRGVALPRRENGFEYLSREDAQKLLVEAERQARAGKSAEWVRYVCVALGLYAGLRQGE